MFHFRNLIDATQPLTSHTRVLNPLAHDNQDEHARKTSLQTTYPAKPTQTPAQKHAQPKPLRLRAQTTPIPSFPRTREPSPRTPNRSVAARKPVPPKDDQLHNQRLFRANPNKFAKHVLGVEPWGKQRDILSAIAHNRKVAVRSCNGAGKTFTAAVAVLWWLMSYDNAIVITTAPSERQVKELLWREIRQLYMPRRDTIGGKLTRTRLDFASNRYAYGFSTNTEDRFQGFHSGNILVIVDEASGVDEFIYYAISGILTTQNAKLLLIGNPHGLAGTFYDAFHKNRKGYHTVHISAFDTPAFTEAGITAENIADLEYPDPAPVIPADAHVIPADAGTQGKTNHANSRIPLGLSTPLWALSTFNEYGPQSSVFQTRVLGDFPSQANDTLIALRDIESAVKRPHVVQPDDKPIVGLDIARFGDDKTVIIVRHGMRVLHIEELRKSDLVNTTGRVITVADEFKVRHVMIDEVGIGAGVLDTLKQDKKFITTGINGGSRSDDPNKYGNLRAQIFDGLRQRFADGQISIPNDPELISQLASLTYRYNARGQLLLESKEIIKGHGRQSPDKADALAYAFAEHRATKREWGIITYTPKTLARLRRAQRRDPRWRD